MVAHAELVRWPGTAAPLDPAGPRRAIVFVHGIFSDHETFNVAQATFARSDALAAFEFFYIDYPYNDATDANGVQLADALVGEFKDSDRVVIFAHSMGGLVARFAVLSRPMSFVKMVFLMGTPNSGAIRVSQLTALLQLLHRTTKVFSAVFPRQSGIASLSDVAAKFDQHRIHGAGANALEVAYVSIPGKRFNDERSAWDFGLSGSGLAFSALDGVFLRLLSIKLSRAHDGIVEESSNNLLKAPLWSEKVDSYGSPRGDRPATYMHFTVSACNQLNHVPIHMNDEVLATVEMIIDAYFGQQSLDGWISRLDPYIKSRYGIEAAFDKK